MSRRIHVPAYRLHKPSGQARVIIDGRHIYLGRYGSPESREKYARLIAERAVSPGPNGYIVNARQGLPELTVEELLAAYWRFAKTYYSKDGVPTKELACMRAALRPLRRLYGDTSTQHFGPKAHPTRIAQMDGRVTGTRIADAGASSVLSGPKCCGLETGIQAIQLSPRYPGLDRRFP